MCAGRALCSLRRNFKFEARNPKSKQARILKMQDDVNKGSFKFENLNFGFVSDFDIRISDF